jgi:AcrR family transcriptional regulator
VGGAKMQSSGKIKSSSESAGASKKGRGRPKKDSHLDQEGAREKLILAGVRLFSLRGFEGTTVKELCDEAGLNVSLISYHFEGKEGLYRAVLERFGATKLASVERLLQTPRNKDELRIRLNMFVQDLLDGFVEEPDLTTIIYREAESPHDFIDDIFREHFLKLFDTIVTFLEAGQKGGIIRADIVPRLSAGLLFGGITHFFRMARVSKMYKRRTIDDNNLRRELIEHIEKVYLHGLLSTK